MNTQEKVCRWLRDKCADDSVRDALNAGWTPSKLSDAVDWWRERMLLDPIEHIEEVTDDLLLHLNVGEALNRVESFYAAEAANYLTELDLGHKITHVGKVKELHEALRWLSRNSESRIAADSLSAFEENRGASFVRVLYDVGAESVEVDAYDGDEVAFYVNVVLPEDWETQVRIIMELGRALPDKIEVVDKRTIKLILSDAQAGPPSA